MSPVPMPVLARFAQPLQGVGATVAHIMPNFALELEQADIEIEPQEFVAMGLITAIFYFFLLSIVISFLVIIAKYREVITVDWASALLIGPGLGLVFAFLVLLQVTQYPKIQIKRKIRNLEQNLIFGLRTITVQIRSGVTLFDALSLIADGNYGALSTEFRKSVDEINTGVAEEDALQRSALRNPSLFYRRAIWQIVNGMKAGADITKVLSELVNSMTKEQVIQIKKYGASLRLLSLIYMMLGVIIPALGLTFMIILSTFPQIPITPELLWGFLGFLVLSQFMFLGLLKSKRPSLMTES